MFFRRGRGFLLFHFLHDRGGGAATTSTASPGGNDVRALRAAVLRRDCASPSSMPDLLQFYRERGSRACAARC